jgi:hypothetical protein
LPNYLNLQLREEHNAESKKFLSFATPKATPRLQRHPNQTPLGMARQRQSWQKSLAIILGFMQFNLLLSRIFQ